VSLEALLGQPELGGLPVLDVLPELAEKLAASPLTALEAPPGSGKTLLAPAWLVRQGAYRRVFVLVPRRVNARLPVLFLERFLGPAVGYRIRFESRWDEARLQVGYLTYGTALRVFAERPPGPADLVIFDELHERPWEADVLLAYLRHLQGKQRGPSLLLMSATLDTASLPQSTAIVRSDGRLHPVTVSREKVEPMLLGRQESLAALVAQRSAELAAEGPGEQLIFLPGLSAIRSCQEALRADRLGGAVDILHSSLAEAEIRRVVERPPCDGFRRILSTDLAESSLTLPGVTAVLDAGLQRRPRRDPFGLGITLETVRAPLASLQQRAGRAGRLRPGRCHRLLTHQDELHRAPFEDPEILRVDGKSLALHLARLELLAGWAELPWLDPPNQVWLREAIGWLAGHGLLDSQGLLSSRGMAVLRSTCSPRCGLFGLLAREAGWPLGRTVDWVYALQSGPPIEAGAPSLSLSDLLQDKAWRGRRETRLLARLEETLATVAGREGAGDPLLQAYADTVVELRGDRALPSLPASDALLYRSSEKGAGYAVLLGSAPAGPSAGPASLVTLYQPVTGEALWEELLDRFSETSQLHWDPASKQAREVRRTCLGSLILEEESRAATPGPAVAALLEQSLGPADWGQDWALFERRLRLFLEVHPESAETALGSAHDPAHGQPSELLRALRLAYLETVSRWSRESPREMLESSRQILGYALLREMDKELPTSVALPGRQRPVPVHYPEQGSPFVASKLQDFFGWAPPRLLGGRLSLACHLLAPSGRPVQITQDLEGFWRGSYQQVRKDLRGRYPKHSWPAEP
jgi:ATP-dependent helicase HrpB